LEEDGLEDAQPITPRFLMLLLLFNGIGRVLAAAVEVSTVLKLDVKCCDHESAITACISCTQETIKMEARQHVDNDIV